MSSETNIQLFPGVFRSTVGGENPGFFLHSDGRVGIGNKAPTTRPLWSSDDTDRNKLNVTGHTHIDGNLNVTGYLYGDGSNLSGVAAVVGGYWDLDASNNNIKYEAGNVGIGGAASGTEALTVYGDLNLKSGGQLKLNGQTPVFSNWSVDGSDIYRSTGNVGIGTTTPSGTLHVKAQNRVHITAETTPAFTGLEATSSVTGRSQLVLSSMYSDLVIASSAVNNDHGSTLSFASVNPGNTAEYRKFVINQGNWGSRKDFLDFGLSASASDPNPHSSINSTATVLTLDGNNKRVGIGTINPGYKLHVYDSGAASGWQNFYVRPTSLWGDGLTTASETAGTKYMTMNMVMLQAPHITPSGTGQDAYIRYGRAGGIASGNWWETACVTDGSFRIRREANNSYGMTINSSGNVGIGTTTPYVKLHVNGGSNPNISYARRSYFLFFSGSLQTESYFWNETTSIYATADIISGRAVVAHEGTIGASDKRIKKEIVDVEDGSALDTLRLLKPKKYKYVDEVHRGTEPVWGFIAQEVRETLPYATQLRTDCLPNIYELANVSNSNVITFTNFDTSNLESNAMVLKVYDEDDTEHLVNIVEVVDEHSVRVDEDLTEWIGTVEGSEGDKIFVYGQQVDDFVFLKKEAIWTVATSALQEVDRQLQAEKEKVKSLEERLAALEAIVLNQ